MNDLMRGLILATQFLTRLPTPQVDDFRPDDLSRSAVWFPAVGLLVGSIVCVATWLGAQLDPWLAALFGLLAWVWVTGGLHLDGLADLADGLGAAHRDPARLLAVMRDPHLGAFGVLALGLQLIFKLVLLMLLAREGLWLLLLLIPAWARLGPLLWTRVLPALEPGMGERFAWAISNRTLIVGMLALLISSAWTPNLLLAPLVLAAWAWFLHHTLGGMSGDTLGAGIELSETTLLLIVLGFSLA
ncbi:MAG: adenosylcobinamide-GDP ribazoletransferase [Halothiobacillaceae bacterium]|nr:adenosylcobinamide-GDP ribazoletransferase [Halothiobacillaceae bacterium]